MKKIEVYTDGGCSGNPGPGGWAFIIKDDTGKTSRYGTEASTTNNRMELTAVISAIEWILARDEYKNCQVDLYTDSQYVKKGITAWIYNWEKNGWLTAAKKPVKNREYWKQLKAAASELHIEWHWIMAHAGNSLNEECDKMVQLAVKAIK